MKTKKIIASVLSLVVAAGMLAGCGGTKTAENTEITTISIWHPNTHTKEYFEKKVAEYNETTGKKKGIKIEYECKTDLNKQMELALANETAPDIIMEINAATTQKAAELGQIVALDDIPGGQEIIDKYKDYIAPNGFNDKTYKVPYNVNTRALIYNKDMFKAAGIVDENGEPTPPETYEEVVEYAKKLTNPDKNQYGIVIPVKWGGWPNELFGAVMCSSGSRGFDPKTGTYDYTGLKPLLKMYEQIKADGSYLPGADAIDNDPARARFAEGNIGMKFSLSYDVAVLTEQFPAKCDWGVAPLPVADANQKYLQDAQVNQFACINAKAVEEKGAEKVLEVYKWFVSDEVMQDMYKKGYYIPVSYDVIKAIDSKDVEAPAQWMDYGNMLQVSVNSPSEIPRDYGEEVTHSAAISNYFWTGKWDINKTIAQMNEAAENAINRYMENHPAFNRNIYILDDWDVSRKD